jgi:multidrug efflux system membrane fusion protein
MKRLLLVLLVVAGAAWYADYAGWVHVPYLGQEARAQRQGPAGGRSAGRNAEPPPPVLTVEVKKADVPVTADAVGTVQALNTVTVRTQVDGRLMELRFSDGQDVKKGDVLAVIDARTYQAQYDSAVAKKAQDEAQLANAKIDLDRYTRLAETNFGSKQQADTQRATVAQLTAQVQVDQAAVENAKTVLDYATIRAPIDGRTGIRAVDIGNILHASDANGIVTITEVRPIAVVFNLPQQQLLALNAAMARGKAPAQALAPDNATLLDQGNVEVIDNLIDQTTGTVKVKAIFPNEKQQLWPGQFVNVRLFIDTLRDVNIVPTAAVQRGPTGPFVYVLRDDSTVKKTDVVVGRQDETTSVIQRGLAPPTRVVTTGFARISDGTKVNASLPDAAPTPSADAPTPERRGRGQRRGDLGVPAGAAPG